MYTYKVTMYVFGYDDAKVYVFQCSDADEATQRAYAKAAKETGHKKTAMTIEEVKKIG